MSGFLRIVAATFLVVSPLIALPAPSMASGSFSISQTFPVDGAGGVPVNLASATYKPSFGYANQAISLSLSGLPDHGCSAVSSSVTLTSSQLSSSNPDDFAYSLTTATFGNSASGAWLALGSATSGFELLPHTSYTLHVKSGPAGIKITCSGTDYFLNSDKTISFTTGDDTVAPQIMGPQSAATSTTATVSWETFQAASGQVAYGTGALVSTINQSGMSKLHRLTLIGLAPGTAYNFQVRSADAAGNQATYNGQVTTVGLVEVKVSDVTDMAATITWTSNQTTDTLVEFGSDQQYGDRQGNGGQLTNHSLRLVGLRPDTTYHFRVVATNSSGSSTFNDNVFATLPSVAVAGSATSDTSTSNDNIKLFPQTPFAQPLVLGASSAASAASNGLIIGRNLLSGRSPSGAALPGWVKIVFWATPLLLILFIAGAWWKVRQHEQALRATATAE